MLLTAIACAASFSDHQYPAGVLTLCATISVLLVVILGFKHGDRKFERLDIICQTGALIGLALWATFDSPALAIIATITIDLIGCIPTIAHSWQKPYEETSVTYAMSSVAGGLAFLATQEWKITAVAYPIYLFLINMLLAFVILSSPNKKLQGEPAQLKEL
ncbi:MAG: hypothetical protein JWL89_202 [Candidatus Saccharibacteria bacterium]|nr:hypothetical protein [Candidatus Saccharibacteria bacterium]